jgi:hypothetical protein
LPITFSAYSLFGLLIMGGFGLIALGLYQRWLYPVQRLAHEEAKVTGTQGRDPNVYKITVKIITLIIMPATGFLFGDMMLAGLAG